MAIAASFDFISVVIYPGPGLRRNLSEIHRVP
jgi:hypothetical protein